MRKCDSMAFVIFTEAAMFTLQQACDIARRYWRCVAPSRPIADLTAEEHPTHWVIRFEGPIQGDHFGTTCAMALVVDRFTGAISSNAARRRHPVKLNEFPAKRSLFDECGLAAIAEMEARRSLMEG